MFRAALLFAAGANLEVWALLGVPVVLLAPTLRASLRSAAAAVIAAGTPFRPFVVAGPCSQPRSASTT